MSDKYVLRSEGVYNTTNLVNCSLREAGPDKTVLLLGYSQNSKDNIIMEIREKNAYVPKNFRVKNWFSFLLEDLIRPYQTESIEKRTGHIVYHNSSASTVVESATQENEQDGMFKNHYFHENGIRAQFLAEFTTQFCKSTKFPVVDRLAKIYSKIFIDETNMFDNWDFAVLELILANNNIDIYCAGDFRKQGKNTFPLRSRYLEKNYENRKWFKNNGFQEINNYNSPVKHSVKLIKSKTSEIVDAEIVNVATEEIIGKIEENWTHPENSDIASCNIRSLIDRIKGQDAFQKFILVSNEMPQAVLIFSTGSYSRFDKSKELLYINLIEYAPWNQALSNSADKLKGMGPILLLLSFHYSRSMGFEGRLGLHSLPHSVDFFENAGMRNCGQDSEYAQLTYFELAAEHGNELLRIGNPS